MCVRTGTRAGMHGRGPRRKWLQDLVGLAVEQGLVVPIAEDNSALRLPGARSRHLFGHCLLHLAIGRNGVPGVDRQTSDPSQGMSASTSVKEAAPAFLGGIRTPPVSNLHSLDDSKEGITCSRH